MSMPLQAGEHKSTSQHRGRWSTALVLRGRWLARAAKQELDAAKVADAKNRV